MPTIRKTLDLVRKLVSPVAACLAVFSFDAISAGVREPAIGLEFPDRLGGLALKGRTQFPKPGEGANIAYEAGAMRGAVYVYNAGLKEIPAGVGSPKIHMHFLETTAALQRAGAEGPGGARVTPVKSRTISAYPGCGPQFLWRSDAIEMSGQRMITRTYLTGYNNHFVKLRVTHPPGDDQAAEQFVQEARRLLGKCA
jgi:hypothetical protein